MAKREYFTFYRSYYEQISDCDDPDARLEMYEILLNYAFNKIEPDFKKDKFLPMTRFFWKGAKAVMQKNWSQYENGCKGGAPIGNTNNKGKKRVNPKLTQSQAYKDKDKEEDKEIELNNKSDSYEIYESATEQRGEEPGQRQEHTNNNRVNGEGRGVKGEDW